jgi:integrase
MISRSKSSKGKRAKQRTPPSTENGTVPPLRVENATRRPREYLTVKEVTKLIDGARDRGRYGHRDTTMILVAYRHGLRVSELCALRWDQVDFAAACFTCAESRAERRVFTRSVEPSCDHCGECCANNRSRGTSFLRSDDHRCHQRGFARCSREQGREVSFHFQCIRTCFGMRAATSLPMMGRTREPCNII